MLFLKQKLRVIRFVENHFCLSDNMEAVVLKCFINLLHLLTELHCAFEKQINVFCQTNTSSSEYNELISITIKWQPSEQWLITNNFYDVNTDINMGRP